MFVVDLDKICDASLSPILNAFQMLEHCQALVTVTWYECTLSLKYASNKIFGNCGHLCNARESYLSPISGSHGQWWNHGQLCHWKYVRRMTRNLLKLGYYINKTVL